MNQKTKREIENLLRMPLGRGALTAARSMYDSVVLSDTEKTLMKNITDQLNGDESAPVFYPFVMAAKFWNDHIGRECEDDAHGVGEEFASIEVRSSSAEWSSGAADEPVVVIMSSPGMAELISDAHYYATSFGEEYSDLADSALVCLALAAIQEPFGLSFDLSVGSVKVVSEPLPVY